MIFVRFPLLPKTDHCENRCLCNIENEGNSPFNFDILKKGKIMKYTKTAIRELSQRYRAILKKCLFLNAVAIGLLCATNAHAAINVQEGTTDITDSVIEAVLDNAKTAFSDGSYNTTTWDSATNTKVTGTDKTTTAATDPGAAPTADSISLDLSTGSTNLSAAAGGSYSLTDPTVDPTKVNLDKTSYSYEKTKVDGTKENATLDQAVSKDDYNFTTSAANRVDGKNSLNIESGQVSRSDYQFSVDGVSYNLNDFWGEDDKLDFNKVNELGSDAQTAVIEASKAYDADKNAYENVLGYYNAAQSAYDEANTAFNADQEKVNAGIEELRKQVGEYEAAKTTYEDYNTAKADADKYENSLSKVMDDKAETKANSAISDALAEGGSISDAIGAANDQIRQDFADADTALKAALESQISDEATKRTEADDQIRQDFADADTTLKTALESQISDEATKRTEADDQIRQDFADADTALKTDLEGQISEEITARETAVNEINGKIGDLGAFTGSTTGNISNGPGDNATTVSDAIANIDATLGTIHGLNTKRGEDAKGNLATGTTVEDHLTALDDAIGNRANLSGQYVSNADVASNLQSLNDGLEGEVSRATAAEAVLDGKITAETTRATAAEEAIRSDLRNTQVQYEARFSNIESKINKLEDKMEKGLAATAALAGLQPLSNAHQTQLSAAVGGYGSNQALAVGAFHYINDRTLLNAGSAYGGNSNVSYKVGITFGF